MRKIERSPGFKREAWETHRAQLDDGLKPVLMTLVTGQLLADQFAAGRCNSYSARGWNTHPHLILESDEPYPGIKLGYRKGLQYS